MPIFARNELGVDSSGLGLLLFAFGSGAVGASLGWTMIGNRQSVGKYMIGSVVVWHASILVFATSHAFFVSMVILVVTGAGFASTQFFMLSALLGNSRSEYRGRVMSLYGMVWSFMLVGGAALDGGAEFSGPKTTWCFLVKHYSCRISPGHDYGTENLAISFH